ncbi:phage tail assembly protein [Bartonella rattaustraliani]|uniref:phage tail assembly protein n=1 Tax=Bartonella rattaustraliani TaxID=481139 RepID=UPI003CC6E782
MRIRRGPEYNKRITYQLFSPIEVIGKTYTEMTLHHPKYKSLALIKKKKSVEQFIEMIAYPSRWFYKTINELKSL